MSRFISFTTYYVYDRGQKTRRRAETQLNEWLEQNSDVEIISWKPCEMEGEWDCVRKTYEKVICIVVEYRKREVM